MKQRLWRWLKQSWRQLLIVALVLGGATALYCFALGSLVPSFSTHEVSFIQSADSGKDILNNPLFLPQKALIYLLIKLGFTSPFALRLPSVGLALLAVGSLFLIMRRWYTSRIAALGSWLMLSSSWLLGAGRLASSDVSYLLLLPLLWAGFYLYTTRKNNLALVLLCIIAAATLYIPGSLWLVLMIFIWKFRTIWQDVWAIKTGTKLVGLLVALLILFPLAWAVAHSSDIALSVLGLPHTIQDVIHMPQQGLHTVQQLFIIAPFDPVHTIGRLPLLDIFTTVVAALGLYSLRYQLKLMRGRLQITLLLVLGLLVAGGGVNIVLLLPVIYLLAAAGLAFLLQQWLTVFPRNPLAQSVGTTLLSICILLVSFYHINRYFVAWPQTPATRSTFSRSLLQ